MKGSELGRFALCVSIGIAMLAGCGGSQPPPAAPGTTPVENNGSLPYHKTFQYTGAKQAFIVPRDVTEIRVIAIGGTGANDARRYRKAPHSIGGYGGRVSAVIPVSPHEKLVIYVGGNASALNGGFNGGGNGSASDDPDGLGGGGASDVREHGGKLSDRILVAGGGGGAGGDGDYGPPGQSDGGKGGGLIGGSGSGGGSYTNSGGGGGGGSSYVEPSATNVRMWQGWKETKHGLVVFDWSEAR
jgi:hypothetical protein